MIKTRTSTKTSSRPRMRVTRSTAKASVWSSRVVGRKYRERDGWGGYRMVTQPDYTMWFYAVRDSEGKVVLEDNCSRYHTILADALEGVAAVRTIENAGHTLPYSYERLVEMVMAADL